MEREGILYILKPYGMLELVFKGKKENPGDRCIKRA
jgi:hypothetical protein